HQGATTVTSAPGRGTTVQVMFPIAAKEAAPISAPPRDGSRKGLGRILVVDDEAVVRQMAQRTLERHGYTVTAAENGPAAIAIFEAQARDIALVVLDLTMPLLSGEETFRVLQDHAPDVCVVLSSGYNEAEALRRFAGRGLAGFLQKPYTAAQLMQTVDSLVPTSRAQAG